MSVAADQLVSAETDLSLSSGPVASATVLYAGTAAFRNSGGYLDDDTASGANKFAGVVKSKVDNSGGGNGDLKAELFTERRIKCAISGASQDDVDKPVYATDNFTFTLDPAAANAVYVGRFAEYLGTGLGMVEIDVDDPISAHVADVDSQAIAAINGGAIGSGDATTDTVITSLRTEAGHAKTVIDSLRTTLNSVLDILEAAGLVRKA